MPEPQSCHLVGERRRAVGRRRLVRLGQVDAVAAEGLQLLRTRHVLQRLLHARL